MADSGRKLVMFGDSGAVCGDGVCHVPPAAKVSTGEEPGRAPEGGEEPDEVAH